MRLMTEEEFFGKYYPKENEEEKRKRRETFQRRGSIFIEFKVRDWKNRIKSINRYLEKVVKKLKISEGKYIFSSAINIHKNEFVVEFYQPRRALNSNEEIIERIENCIEKKSDSKR